MSLKHISGWVNVQDAGPSLIDPGYGQPGWEPVDPGWGGGPPVYPGHGLPGLGHVGGGPIAPPLHPGNKPPGRPILPPSIDNGLPPSGAHPWLPGHWEILDPGFGKPPVIGFVPVDPGFGLPVTPPPVVGGGPVVPPACSWVPVDPDYGHPGCPDKPKPPIWAWLPDFKPPDYTKPPVGKPPDTAQPK